MSKQLIKRVEVKIMLKDECLEFALITPYQKEIYGDKEINAQEVLDDVLKKIEKRLRDFVEE